MTRGGRTANPREDGFAMVTALMAAMLFSLFAYTVLAADRGATASLDAQMQRARLEAAAEAGLATAVQGLGAAREQRWALDGRSRILTLDGMEVAVVVEDERGKVPLNGVKPEQARRLFQAAGVSGGRLDQLTDNLLNWMDGGERPGGAKDIDYAADDVRPRLGPIRTVDELMAIKGMDAEILDRIRPALTLFFGDRGVFDRTTSSPLALKAMTSDGENGVDAIVRARELAGQQAALADDPVDEHVGRPMTVRITARDGRGGVFRRAAVVELTGRREHPYWLRAID